MPLFGFPAARFVIDGAANTTGNSWNVNSVDSTGDAVEEELVLEDFVTRAATWLRNCPETGTGLVC
jgi:hypothetical protein